MGNISKTYPSMTINNIPFYIDDSLHYNFIPSVINVFVYVDNLPSRNAIDNIRQSIKNKQLISLGNGYVCKHCGTYTPGGGIRCRKCGGELEIENLVNPSNIPFHFDNMSVIIKNNHLKAIEIECRRDSKKDAYEDFIKNAIAGRSKITSIRHPVKIDGRWVCQYCGTIIDPNEECRNCGGKRLPMSELIKIDHNCLYCGQKSLGVVCDYCAANLAATTIDSVL